MYTFWLVIVDLFWFVLGKSTPDTAGQKTLPAPEPALLLAEPTLETPPLFPQETTIAHTTAAVIETPAPALLNAPVIMYVAAMNGTARYTAPQAEFDGVMEVVPYGTAVTVVGYRGRYASVLRAHHTGWIVKDDLNPDKFSVWPQFNFKQEYFATDSDTLKVRALIQDEFGAGGLGLPLQAGEYIAVRMLSDHRTIAWTEARPRLPGDWQNILRGVRGVHSTVTPKTDSIMEWRTESGEGRLAYVEAVAPDNTISLSLVGLHDAGQYLTQTLTEDEWRELRPVFIDVT